MIDNLHDAIDGESLDPMISREKAQELEIRLISLGIYLKDSGRAAFCCSGYTAHYSSIRTSVMSCAPHHPSPSIANMCGPSVTGRGIFSKSTNGYPKASWRIELSGGWKTTVSRFRRSARSRNRKIAGSDRRHQQAVLQNCPRVHDPIGKRRPRRPRKVKNAGEGSEPEQDLQA